MMRRLQFWCGLAFSALTDISAGVIITYLVAKVYGIPVHPWLYAVGGLLTLSPDIDIALQGLWRRLFGTRWQAPTADHRDILHYPLLLLIGSIALGYFVSGFWGWLVGMCLMFHFFDDSTDPGGIRWLWPITGRKFQFLVTQTAPLSLHEWVEQYWLRLSHKSVAGGVLVLAAIAVIILR